MIMSMYCKYFLKEGRGGVIFTSPLPIYNKDKSFKSNS